MEKILTIKECNERIAKIEAEMARLQQDRQFTVAVRSLVRNDIRKPRVSGSYPEIYKEILQIIHDFPGCSGSDIREKLSINFNGTQMSY